MYKLIAVGGIALLTVFFAPSAASADTRVGVTLGGGYYPTYPAYDPTYPDDDGYEDEDDDYISCSEGRRILRDYGFRQARVVSCGGEVYRYRALKRYRIWSIKVSARSGRILGSRVIGDYDDFY